jgi:hypothetical protein
MIVVLKAFVEHCVSLVLGHTFEFSWLDVSQQMYFIVLLLLDGARSAGVADFLSLFQVTKSDTS